MTFSEINPMQNIKQKRLYLKNKIKEHKKIKENC